jgi:DNA polymerase III subunit gamma/tau
MAHYKVLARKYRPQSFHEVLGQDAVVTTLKNALKHQRLAQAYLFSGSRGTGKTTLARVFAKALNCAAPLPDGEPCNQCSSCKEIQAGTSIDILEIDGASHRGIDDIRQINETVVYASTSGKYKIYIIDEVHMLTKEAFNALLKTLEEPPAKVLFLFATTEPHKVLPTILSRCQRFNLNRIPLDKIVQKLQRIALEMAIDVQPEALQMIAQRAEGGLRDAESLFDQIISFHEGQISTVTVADLLGIMPKECLFLLDQAGKEGRLAAAFEIAERVFAQGKDLLHFVESLSEHFRSLLLLKLCGAHSPLLNLAEAEREAYDRSAKLYSQEQCTTIIDLLIEAQSQIRFHSSGRLALEALLLRIMRTHQRLPIELLVRRLVELEQAVAHTEKQASLPVLAPSQASAPPRQASQASAPPRQASQASAPPRQPQPAAKEFVEMKPAEAGENKRKLYQPLVENQLEAGIKPVSSEIKPTAAPLSLTEDPVPSPMDLPKAAQPIPTNSAAPSPPKEGAPLSAAKQHRYDTLMQFAAVELEGTLKKQTTR